MESLGSENRNQEENHQNKKRKDSCESSCTSSYKRVKVDVDRKDLKAAETLLGFMHDEDDDDDDDLNEGDDEDYELEEEEEEEEEEGILDDEDDECSPLLSSPSERKRFRELLSKVPFSQLVDQEEEEVTINQNYVEESRRGFESFPTLYFMCAVRNAMFALMDSTNNIQGMQSAANEDQVPTFSIADIIQKLISLYNEDIRIVGTPNEPPRFSPEVATRGVLTVLSVKPHGRVRVPWAPLTSCDQSTGHWKWVGPTTEPYKNRYRRRRPMDEKMLGVSKSMEKHLVKSLNGWLETEERFSAALATIRWTEKPVAVYELFGFLARLRSEYGRKFRVPWSFPVVRARYQFEERLRYSVPERPFYYTTIDGEKSSVSSIHASKNSAPISRSSHLILNRPDRVSLLSLVRDATSRLPLGEGSVTDVCRLLKDSQYLISELTEQNLKPIVSNALNRLRREKDPCVVFVGATWRIGSWKYLHRNRDLREFRGDGRQVLVNYAERRRHGMKTTHKTGEISL